VRGSASATAPDPGRRSHPRRAGRGPLRLVGLVLVTAALVIVAGSSQAYWLCVPVILLAAMMQPTRAGAVLAAITGAAAAGLPLVALHVRPLPTPWLAVFVPASSVAILTAVRERLEHQREALRDVALSDPLTGVANRRLLLARAEYEIARHAREDRCFAVVMLDLDGFKLLNDRFGHAAGDELLCDVAGALTHAVRGQDTVARIGGDEFCVLAPQTDRTGLARLSNRIARAMAGATAGVETLRASVGVAVFPEDGRTAAVLLQTADERLLAAKRERAPRGRRRAA
jgi:diguanylate cyclase (GGDEF)-like protein